MLLKNSKSSKKTKMQATAVMRMNMIKTTAKKIKLILRSLKLLNPHILILMMTIWSLKTQIKRKKRTG
jgi:hypothetical protein